MRLSTKWLSWERWLGVAYLTLGTDPDVAAHWSVRAQVHRLLDANVGEGIFPEDGASVQVSRHEATEPR